MAAITGTNIPGTIRPFTTEDKFPTAFANEIKGGWHNVSTLAERDAIPAERRETGMAVCVADGTVYRLLGGLTNEYWQEWEGARGEPGEPGNPGEAAIISSVSATTLPPGSQATVTVGGTPQNRSFEFGMPSGADGKSPYVGPNGNWYEWNGAEFADTGKRAEQIITTELDPDDPDFPDVPGAVILTTNGQPPQIPVVLPTVHVEVLPSDAAPEAVFSGTAQEPVWTFGMPAVPDPVFNSTVNVSMMDEDYGGSASLYKNPTTGVLTLNLLLPRATPGSGGGGLPDGFGTATTVEELQELISYGIQYIYVPNLLELTDSLELGGNNVVIDGMGRGGLYSDRWNQYEIDVLLENSVFKNFTFQCTTRMRGRGVRYTNCRFAGISQDESVWTFTAGPDGSMSFNGCFFQTDLMCVGEASIAATGCVLGGEIINDMDSDAHLGQAGNSQLNGDPGNLGFY